MPVRSSSRSFAVPIFVLIAGILLVATFGPASAELAHHPFAIGANEGAVGHQSGLGAWVLSQESRFYRGLTEAVRAVRDPRRGLPLLVGLSFAYGVFHAAGPGHGKAVITSYMVSNEVALRRGLLISLCAALLQGFVATALVGSAALIFHATAQKMNEAAQAAELASYLGIVALGLLLVWRKGRAFVAALRPVRAPLVLGFAAAGPGGPPAPVSRFRADDGADHVHHAACGCGHAHMPAPERFAGRRFDWRAAGIAILTAGARPCSGAILVLVFSITQGLFLAGILATFAMAIGTAVTTGALATFAVFAKDAALRISGGEGAARALLLGRLIELGAAACVLAVGVVLLAAAYTGATSAA